MALKASQDSKGNPIMVEMTPEELAAMQQPVSDWHKAKQFRIILNLECLRILNLKKEFNDEVNQLYTYFKSTELDKVEVNDSLFIYVDQIYHEHRALIEQNGGVIESKYE